LLPTLPFQFPYLVAHVIAAVSVITTSLLSTGAAVRLAWRPPLR